MPPEGHLLARILYATLANFHFENVFIGGFEPLLAPVMVTVRPNTDKNIYKMIFWK
jgi:hypothetical protein